MATRRHAQMKLAKSDRQHKFNYKNKLKLRHYFRFTNLRYWTKRRLAIWSLLQEQCQKCFFKISSWELIVTSSLISQFHSFMPAILTHLFWLSLGSSLKQHMQNIPQHIPPLKKMFECNLIKHYRLLIFSCPWWIEDSSQPSYSEKVVSFFTIVQNLFTATRWPDFGLATLSFSIV